MRVLISGAGIAGLTLAYWLDHYGFSTCVIEKAPRLRTGGYMIDFWGAGYDVAQRMDLLPEIERKGYRVREVRVVAQDGRTVTAFPADAFSRVARGRYTSLPRGDLAAVLFSRVEARIETLFGDSVARLDQNERGVQVTLDSGAVRDFDLVIGADGLHSRIREIVFGPEQGFEKYLGYKAAAFETQGYRPRDELVYVLYTEIGQQVARFAMRNDRTMFLFTFADESPDASGGAPAQKALLRRRFGNSGWECPEILAALDTSDDLYFDRVSQIVMSPEPGSWARGRVSLLGDAAFCVSLLAGQGSALAMTAAYILAGELHRARGDYAAGFARYQELFGPFVRGKQKAALRFAASFAPKSRLSLFLRNQVMRLLTIPIVADFAFRRDFLDRIALPEY